MTIPPEFHRAAEPLHAAAIAATGLSDFGDRASYMPGLQRFLDALDDNGPRFTSAGRKFAQNTLVGVLIARLLTEQGWKDHPGCLEVPVRRPIIILGIPRTGTTALHKLLSMDPMFQGMERWLTAFPMPRPARSEWEQNPWYQACNTGLEEFFAQAPEMRAAHDMRADDVDECLEILKQDFCSNYYGSTFRVPKYDNWWRRQSEQPSYQRLLRVLQLIGYNSPNQTWLLKNPGHLAEIDALLDTFPDACIIQTHRHPAATIPSLCSVLKQARAITEGNTIDQREIGERELDYWSKAIENAERARQRAPKQFLDVSQRDLHKDPMGVIQRIYEHFDLTLTPDAEARMRQRIEQAPEAQYGQHNYSASDFGLSDERIANHFKRYIDAHFHQAMA